MKKEPRIIVNRHWQCPFCYERMVGEVIASYKRPNAETGKMDTIERVKCTVCGILYERTIK